jgi:hypothetical protein
MGDAKGKKGNRDAKPQFSKEDLATLVSQDIANSGGGVISKKKFRILHTNLDLSDNALKGWSEIVEMAWKIYKKDKEALSPAAQVDDSRYQPPVDYVGTDRTRETGPHLQDPDGAFPLPSTLPDLVTGEHAAVGAAQDGQVPELRAHPITEEHAAAQDGQVPEARNSIDDVTTRCETGDGRQEGSEPGAQAPVRIGNTHAYVFMPELAPAGTDVEEAKRSAIEQGGVILEPKAKLSPQEALEIGAALKLTSQPGTTLRGMPVVLPESLEGGVVTDEFDPSKQTTNVYEVDGITPGQLYAHADAVERGNPAADEEILQGTSAGPEPTPAPGEVLGTDSDDNNALPEGSHVPTLAGIPVPAELRTLDKIIASIDAEKEPADSGAAVTTLHGIAPMQDRPTVRVEVPTIMGLGTAPTAPAMSVVPYDGRQDAAPVETSPEAAESSKRTLIGIPIPQDAQVTKSHDAAGEPATEVPRVKLAGHSTPPPLPDDVTRRVSMEEIAEKARRDASARQTPANDYVQQDPTAEYFDTSHVVEMVRRRRTPPSGVPAEEKPVEQKPAVAAQEARVTESTTRYGEDNHAGDEAERAAVAARYITPRRETESVARGMEEIRKIAKEEAALAADADAIVRAAFAQTQAAIPTVNPEETTPSDDKAKQAPAPEVIPARTDDRTDVKPMEIAAPAPAPARTGDSILDQVVDLGEKVERTAEESAQKPAKKAEAPVVSLYDHIGRKRAEKARKKNEAEDRARKHREEAARAEEEAARIQQKDEAFEDIQKHGITVHSLYKLGIGTAMGILAIAAVAYVTAPLMKGSDSKGSSREQSRPAAVAVARDAGVKSLDTAIEKAYAAKADAVLRHAPKAPVQTAAPAAVPKPAVAKAPVVSPVPRPYVAVAPRPAPKAPMYAITPSAPARQPVETSDTIGSEDCARAAYKKIAGPATGKMTYQRAFNRLWLEAGRGKELSHQDRWNATDKRAKDLTGKPVLDLLKDRKATFTMSYIDVTQVSGAIPECSTSKTCSEYVKVGFATSVPTSAQVSKVSQGSSPAPYILTKDAVGKIEQLVSDAVSLGETQVCVTGTASITGSDEFNLHLSGSRADIVSHIVQNAPANKGGYVKAITNPVGKVKTLGTSLYDNQVAIVNIGTCPNVKVSERDAKNFGRALKAGVLKRTGNCRVQTTGPTKTGKLDLPAGSGWMGIEDVTPDVAADKYVELVLQTPEYVGSLMNGSELGKLALEREYGQPADVAQGVFDSLRDDVDRAPENAKYKSNALTVEEAVAACYDAADEIRKQDALERFSVDKLAEHFTYNDTCDAASDNIIDSLCDEVHNSPVNAAYKDPAEKFAGMLVAPSEKGKISGEVLASGTRSHLNAIGDLLADVDADPRNAKYELASTFVNGFEVGELAGNVEYLPSQVGESIIDELRDDVHNAPGNDKYEFAGSLVNGFELGELAGNVDYAPADVGEGIIDELMEDIHNAPGNAKYELAGSFVNGFEVSELAGQCDYRTVSDAAIEELQSDVDRATVNEKYRSTELVLADAVQACYDGADRIAQEEAGYAAALTGKYTAGRDDALAEKVLADLRDDINREPQNEKYLTNEEYRQIVIPEIVAGFSDAAESQDAQPLEEERRAA